jgi:hypothetical protein
MKRLPPVRHSVVVALAPEDAFDLFTRGIGRWWPFKGHSCSDAAEADVAFEPRVGGLVTEVAPDGARHSWGALTEWSPPGGFAMVWHPGQPVENATRLAVRFTPVPGGCEVAVEHDSFERRGPEARRSYDEGWPLVLDRYLREASR